MGKLRTMLLCLTDIPKERIIVHENGKKYLAIETWDYEEPDSRDNDFSICASKTKEEIEITDKGGKVERIFLGNGRIW